MSTSHNRNRKQHANSRRRAALVNRVPVNSTDPTCDIHVSYLNKPGVPAVYDGKTVMGPWAFMCESCFGTYGTGLGTGKGQRLKEEASATT